MQFSSPIILRLGLALTLGGVVGASLLSPVRAAGSAPDVTGPIVAGLGAALALGALRPLQARRRSLAAMALGLAAAALLLWPALLERILAVVDGHLHLGPARALTAALGARAILAAAVFRPLVPSPPATWTSAEALAAVTGLTLAILVPLPAAAVGGVFLLGLVLASAARPAEPPEAPWRPRRSRSQRLRAALQAAPGAGARLAGDVTAGFVAGAAAAAAWSAARGTLDPTPVGIGAVIAASTGAFVVGRWVGPAGRWSAGVGRPLLLASALIAAAVAPTALLRLLDALVAPPGAADHRILLPALLALFPALSALLAGAAAGRVRAPPAAVLAGASVGVLLGAGADQRAWLILLVLSAVVGLSALLLATATPRRVVGLLVLVAVGLAAWKAPAPDPRLLVPGVLSRLRDARTWERTGELLDQSTWRMAGWGPDGAVGLRLVNGVPVADLDGSTEERAGRWAGAARLGAHLGMILSPDPRRVLVLGDDLALATPEVLAWSPTVIRVSAARPALTRALVAGQEGLRGTLLDPSVHLEPVPGPWLLRMAGPQDVVLHVARHPWADGDEAWPDRTFLAEVRARLAPGGVYVGVVGLEACDGGALDEALSALGHTFDGAAAWMPPQGADQVLLVGWRGSQTLDWERFADRVSGGPSRLRVLGLDAPVKLAGGAVMAAPALRSRDGRRAVGLPAALAGEGVPLLAVRVQPSPPEETWSGLDGGNLAAIVEILEIHRRFLALVQAGRSGDVPALLDQAASLRQSEDGAAALGALVAPVLQRAREAMDAARQEGPLDRRWEVAANELNLARLLAPDAVEAPRLLAVVQEAQGNVALAERTWREVLRLDPDDLDALFGIARVAAMRGDRITAEEALRQAVTLHPGTWSAWQNLGVLLWRGGQLEEAEEVLRRAAATAPPEEVAPQAALAEVYLSLDRPVAALVAAERAAREAPTAYHLFLKGRAHFLLDQVPAAEDAFRRSVLAEPGFFLSRGALGQIFAERGDLDQAMSAFRQVLAEDPGNAAAMANLQQIERILAAEQSRAEGRAPPPAAPPGSSANPE